MPIAFVLIKVHFGGETEVLEQLKGIDTLKEAHIVFGSADIIAKLESDDRQQIEQAIIWKIRKLTKVADTFTNWVHKSAYK